MRYSADHKKEARALLIGAAARGFKKHGFGGIGVDGLAKEGHVTSGAFYGHFESKDAAFKEVLIAGLEELRDAVKKLQLELGANWLESFVDFYTDYRRTCDMSESCALQSLTSDVIRGTPKIKLSFEKSVREIASAVAAGLEGGTSKIKEERAYALLSILSGGVTMARAVSDPELSNAMAAAIKSAALMVARS